MKVCKLTTTLNFYFILSFVWQKKSKKPVFAPKIIIKNYTFSSSIFNTKKRFKNQDSAFTATLKAIPWYLRGIFSLYFRWTCLRHFLRAGIAFLNLARSCWVILSYIVGPASPTSEKCRIHRPPYGDYKGLHGLIRDYRDTGVTTLGYKVTMLQG